jgi:hypothetical protein
MPQIASSRRGNTSPKEALALSATVRVGWNRKKRRLHEFVAFVGVLGGALVSPVGHRLWIALCHVAGIVQTLRLDEIDKVRRKPYLLPSPNEIPSPSNPEGYRLVRWFILRRLSSGRSIARALLVPVLLLPRTSLRLAPNHKALKRIRLPLNIRSATHQLAANIGSFLRRDCLLRRSRRRQINRIEVRVVAMNVHFSSC